MTTFNVWVTVKYTVDKEEDVSNVEDFVWEALRDAGDEPDSISLEHEEAGEYD